jgi:CheY-like chemotaxis protein
VLQGWGVIEGFWTSGSERGRRPRSVKMPKIVRFAAHRGPLVHSPTLAGQAILVVGDNPLAAHDLKIFFEESGATVLSAAGISEALFFAEHPDLRAAVLDFTLTATDRTAICRRLVERGVPFCFHGEPGASKFQLWPFPDRAPTRTLPSITQ